MTEGSGQRDLIATAERIFPGGVLSRHKLDDENQLVFVSGRGAHVTDAAGREFIDFTCAGGAVLLSYDHPGILAALDAQARRGVHFFSLLNEPAIRYGAELVEVLPLGGMIRFCCSGAEATFNAIRLRPRLYRPQQDPEIRRRLSRPSRLRHVELQPLRRRRLLAGPELGGHGGRDRRRYPDRALQ